MSRIRDYLELMRLRVLLLVAASVAAGFFLGAPAGACDAPLLAVATLGAVLAAGGAAAVNQVIERDADGRMKRTADRPLPAGRMKLCEALAFGVFLMGTGIAVLVFLVNGLSAAVCGASALLYLAVYTPLKRVSAFNTLAGAIPGALPPVVGWAAASGSLDPAACVLFGIVFLWQLPHFMAIAWVHREDYARAGFKMLPLLDAQGGVTARQAVAYAAALLPVSLLPAVVGSGGPLYFYGALYLGVGFLGCALWFWRVRTEEVARQFVWVSVIYLPMLLGLLAQDKALS